MSQTPLRIAHVGPVAGSLPPKKSGSVETMTSLLTEGLVARGHDVTLFATANSTTRARLHAVHPHGYTEDASMWPWEIYELLNLSAAIDRSASFDIVHYQTNYFPMALAFTHLSAAPIVQTLHHSPSPSEVRLWTQYPDAAFIAVSKEQERLLHGTRVVGTVLHGIDTAAYAFSAAPEDYLLFLGRFTAGKGVEQAIDVARRAGIRLILAAAENDYYREHIADLVDGTSVVYYGEADHAEKVRLYGGARALLYPVQAGEPFGLVLAEAMACGTPVAVLDRGAVREVVDDEVTGIVFDSVEGLVEGLERVFRLDRRCVRERAVAKFGLDRMVDEYVAVYRRVIEAYHGAARP
jgi:glycosyltransferase involved in cell wall biosynthesis